MAEPTVVSLPWSEIAKLALGAGLVATIVGQIAEWLKERWRTKHTTERDATYLAARLAIILERFAIECADVISEDKLYTDSKGTAGASAESLPALEPYPNEAEWKSLDPILLTQALSIQNELMISKDLIASTFQFGIDASEVCPGQAGICGYRAWQLAARLRARYGLSDFKLDQFYWDPLAGLKKTHDAEIAAIRETGAAESPF